MAIGLLSIVAMTTLHLVKLINSQARYIANLEDVNNVSKQVASILAIPQNCVSVFGGAALDRTNIGAAATPQLNFGANVPYAGGDPMTDITSGRIRLINLGLIIRRSLAGAGTTWYQGDAVVTAEDPTDPGGFAARKVAINFQLDGTDNVVSCAASGITIGGGAGAGIINSTTGLPYGQCGPGQVMVGLSAKSVICSGGSNTTTGTGCTGDMCVAIDGGPCFGDMCKTNGYLCKGDMCIACGNHSSGSGTATCTGDMCCAGPTCSGCPF